MKLPLAFVAAALASLSLALGSESARADVPVDPFAKVETLGEPTAHWVFVGDPLLQRAALVDLDSRAMLGMVNGGYGQTVPIVATRRPEVYVPATFYSRLFRGTRTDVVMSFDLSTLAPVGEVEIPPKRAIDAVSVAHAALDDTERFVAVFNMTPSTSLSIVDVGRGRFAGELEAPGCGLVYSGGPRRFLMLCGDGSALMITLDASGREASRQRSAPFFDPVADPITEKGVRIADVWHFASFEGWLHSVDVSGPKPQPLEPWALFDDDARAERWRIGGHQHLAAHERSGTLYSLVHQGGPDTHKDSGEEIWVYDTAERRRVRRIELRNPGLTYLGFPIEFGMDWMWPFDRFSERLLDAFAPALVEMIQVTQDDEPLLFTAARFSGSLGVYDAQSGDFVRRVQGLGMAIDLLEAPWGREPRR